MKDIERRNYRNEIRSIEEGGRTVEGYAAIFDSPSEDMGFIERIAPGAFDGVIAESDVLALLNHDERRGVLARSKYGEGTLQLSIDERGLLYRFEAPNTALGDELLENLKRGDIDSSSFAFSIDEEEWRNVGTTVNERWERTIKKVRRLYDVSPVYTPAYSATSCYARALEQLADKKNALEMARQNSELDRIENKY